MSDLPADWAIEKAREIMGLSTDYIAGATFSSGILAFARYIEAHEKPPVDRKLKCAREAAARQQTKCRHIDAYKNGDYDNNLIVQAMVDAITLYEEGFGNDPLS